MNSVKRFFDDRLNVAWVAAVLAVVLVLLFVPNEGLGTIVLIVVGAAAVGVSGVIRVRDGRRDRERRATRGDRRRGPLL